MSTHRVMAVTKASMPDAGARRIDAAAAAERPVAACDTRSVCFFNTAASFDHRIGDRRFPSHDAHREDRRRCASRRRVLAAGLRGAGRRNTAGGLANSLDEGARAMASDRGAQ